MADRYPLIVDSTTSTIKEIQSGDNLDLTNSGIVGLSSLTISETTILGTSSGAASTTTADLRVNGSVGISKRLYIKRPGNTTVSGTANTITSGSSQEGSLLFIENDRKVAISTNISVTGIGTTVGNDSFYVGAGQTYLAGSLCVGIGSTSPMARLDITGISTASSFVNGTPVIRASNYNERAITDPSAFVNSSGIGHFKADNFFEYRTSSSGYFYSDSATIPHTMLVHLNENFSGRSVLRCTSHVGYGNSIRGQEYVPILDVSSTGNVGINTNLPAYSLHVCGPVPSIGSGAIVNAAATLRVEGSATITGALSKGSGSFRIPHPIAENKDLVHSFIEGPRADLIYRGIITLSGGTATVNLDEEYGLTEGTWNALCRNPQVWVTSDTGWTLCKGSVTEGVLTIEAKTSCTETVSWLVVAERKDAHMYDTEWTDENGRPILEPIKE